LEKKLGEMKLVEILDELPVDGDASAIVLFLPFHARGQSFARRKRFVNGLRALLATGHC
jgi:hypothetical protein